MERRAFLRSCALITGAGALSAAAMAINDAATRQYARVRLVDIHNAPIKAQTLEPETNYVFHYPFASTPCFLLNLARPLTVRAELARQDGRKYAWDGGVGRDKSVVAFSAICAHKLAYPTRE